MSNERVTLERKVSAWADTEMEVEAVIAISASSTDRKEPHGELAVSVDGMHVADMNLVVAVELYEMLGEALVSIGALHPDDED